MFVLLFNNNVPPHRQVNHVNQLLTMFAATLVLALRSTMDFIKNMSARDFSDQWWLNHLPVLATSLPINDHTSRQLAGAFMRIYSSRIKN